jgi:hypothetical protein
MRRCRRRRLGALGRRELGEALGPLLSEERSELCVLLAVGDRVELQQRALACRIELGEPQP